MGIEEQIAIEISTQLNKADDYLNNNQNLHALQIFKVLREKYPEHENVIFHLVDFYDKTQNIDAATKEIFEYIEQYPDKLDLRKRFGSIMMANKCYHETIELLSIFPPNEEPLAHFMLGLCYLNVHDLPLSRRCFLNYIENDKDSPGLRIEAYKYLVRISLKLQDYEKALNYGKKALALYANDAETNHLLAEACFNIDMVSNAQVYIEKAISIRKDDPVLLELAGRIYFSNREYKKSEKHYLNYLKVADEDISSEVLMNLGLIYKSLNQSDKSLYYFEMLLRNEPDNELATKEIGSMKLP